MADTYLTAALLSTSQNRYVRNVIVTSFCELGTYIHCLLATSRRHRNGTRWYVVPVQLHLFTAVPDAEEIFVPFLWPSYMPIILIVFYKEK
jgi:hypothetical protein